jgi:AraC family transcriptional regulator of adaptative response / DNA-3-methyladenine glycosylase II
VELRLAFAPPLAAERLLRFLDVRAVPGVEHLDDGRTYRRSVRTPDGSAALLELALTSSERDARLHVHGEDRSAIDGLAEAARRLLDLDADPVSVDAALAHDPALAPLVAATPGTRVPGTVDGFELAVRAIVGQQVSVAGAGTTLGRIVARLGEAFAPPAGSVTHLFPTPAAMASASCADLGVPGRRAEALRTVARLVDTGALDLTERSDPEVTRARLASIPGVGPWTVGYIAMRALRDRDAFPTGDLGVRRGAAALGLGHDDGSIAARAERWRPWRAYAAMHLWHVAP